jgi:hypothetical protein
MEAEWSHGHEIVEIESGLFTRPGAIAKIRVQSRHRALSFLKIPSGNDSHSY